MLKTFAYIAAVIVVVVAGILIYAATRPDTFRVQRTATIKAPPEKIFALINDLRELEPVVALRKEGSGDEADLQRRRTAARAPSMNGTATRTSARGGWRSPRRRRPARS